MHEIETKIEVEKDGSVLRNIMTVIIIVLIVSWVLIDKYYHPPKLTGRIERIVCGVPVVYFYAIANQKEFKHGIK